MTNGSKIDVNKMTDKEKNAVFMTYMLIGGAIFFCGLLSGLVVVGLVFSLR